MADRPIELKYSILLKFYRQAYSLVRSDLQFWRRYICHKKHLSEAAASGGERQRDYIKLSLPLIPNIIKMI